MGLFAWFDLVDRDLSKLNSTNFKAVIGQRILIGTAFVVGLGFGHALWHEHNDLAQKLLDSWLYFLAAVLGISTGQYAIKRNTDREVVAKKAAAKVAVANAQAATAQAHATAEHPAQTPGQPSAKQVNVVMEGDDAG